MTRFVRSAGLRVESLSETWAVYCAKSGESLQLNTEAAAILDVLADGPLDAEGVIRALAQESELPVEIVVEQMSGVWAELLTNGLVELA